MQVALRHPSTGDIKFIATGWSWSLFLFSGVTGLGLFFRGLAMWGTAMLTLWCAEFALPFAAAPGADTDNIAWALTLAGMALSVFLGLKGNALRARHYIACGYEFADPRAAESRVAAEAWGVHPEIRQSW